MSRYIIKDAKGKAVAYGFDNPLSEYFASQGGKTLVGTMSNVYGSATNLYVCLNKLGLWDKIPAEHRDAILGDLPF